MFPDPGESRLKDHRIMFPDPEKKIAQRYS